MDDSQPYPDVFDDVFDTMPAAAAPDSVRFLDDFHLAQECLAGRTSALAYLQETYREPLIAYLQGTGARPDEAHDIIAELWSDCVASQTGAVPKLARYNGTCTLKTFLNTITLNVLMTRRRRERRIAAPLSDDSAQGRPTANSHALVNSAEAIEEPLLQLMRDALQAAFTACPAEDFVLLQLHLQDGLHVAELAKIFHCGIASVSRNVARTGQEIAKATMQNIKANDPWLELKWEDFLDLCRTASPACFGVE